MVKEYAIFNGKRYQRSLKYHKTKEEARKHQKENNRLGYNAIIDKRKEGYFLWYKENVKPLFSKEMERKIDKELKKEGMLKGQKKSNNYEDSILSVLRSDGKKKSKFLTFNAIKNRTGMSEPNVYKSLEKLIKQEKIRSEKVYKELPGGRGLSRKYTVKYELK